MTALLKQKEKNMKAIQPEDQGYWLFTKGSTLYWQENDLPFGTAKELGLTTQKAMLLGKWKSQPLWLVAENDQDEREYLSLRSLLSLPTEDFHLLSRGVEINHFLKTHQFWESAVKKRNKLTMSLRFNAQVVAIVLTQLFALRLLSPFVVAQRFY